jgi:hypothetical protein
MTDFLEQLEDDLRVAAEHRGQPRRRRPTGALKAVVAVAVVALAVAGVARLANGTDTQQAASPSPTPGSKVVYATAGDPALLEVLSARVRGFYWSDLMSAADPQLGTVVLYRPEGEKRAREIAFAASIDDVRPLSEADEQGIQADLRGTEVVVVYGPGNDERLLDNEDICVPGNGDLKLCLDRADERRYSVFVLGDRPLTVEPVDERGWWSWAALSPDGQTILAQWQADCPRAFAIDAGTGERSELGPGKALSWTTDGRVLVAGGCGADQHYLYSLDGGRQPWAGPKDRLEPSYAPLDLGR